MLKMTYREEKGGPLSWQEVDANFRVLENKIDSLKTAPQAVDVIQKIDVDGRTLKIWGRQGHLLAECEIPILTFKSRGQWKAKRSYIPGDIVSIGSRLCLCETPHESHTFQDESENWISLISQPEVKEKLP